MRNDIAPGASRDFYREVFYEEPEIEELVSTHFDANEGRFLDVGCLSCHADVRATYGMAHPVRMYVAAFDCDECGEQLFEFEI